MIRILNDFILEMKQSLNSLNSDHQSQILNAANLIIDCYKNNGSVFVCGNGGSAADAQHIAGELVGRFQKERQPFSCHALTDISILTAIGNDYDFELVFSRQVEAHIKTNDILWAISTSGNSRNIIKAIQTAKNKEAKVLGFTGSQGGIMKNLCDVCFLAPSSKTYCIQQLHQIAYHIICCLVEEKLGEKNGRI